MKTIKIIDLLNKLANGEEVPEKIKYNDRIYTRFQNLDGNRLYYYQALNECVFLVEQISSVGELLNEVELIEEDNNVIGKILTTYDGEIIDYVNGEKHLINTNRKDINIYIPKINELINEINKLKRNNNGK